VKKREKRHTVTIWYSSMNPGLWPANRQSIPRTKATMAQAIGKRADMRIVTVDLKLRLSF
jgi:hypothetical protein